MALKIQPAGALYELPEGGATPVLATWREARVLWPRVRDGPLFRAVRPDGVSLLVST
jgi:hypothetical protein